MTTCQAAEMAQGELGLASINKIPPPLPERKTSDNKIPASLGIPPPPPERKTSTNKIPPPLPERKAYPNKIPPPLPERKVYPVSRLTAM